MFGLKKWSLSAAAGFGAVLASLLTMVLCLPGAALIHRGSLPTAAAQIWGLASAGLSVFLAALVICRFRRRQAAPTAGLLAGLFILVCILLSLFPGCQPPGLWLVRVALAVAAGGSLGAVMSIRQNPHKKRRH